MDPDGLTDAVNYMYLFPLVVTGDVFGAGNEVARLASLIATLA